MIKLQDFARECGVTDRAIQKHLKTYAAELDGLFQRKGPNGTWLTDEACEILRSKMKQLPPAVVDGETVRENDELKQRVRELEARLSEKEKLVEMAQRRADTLQEKVGQVYALEEGKKALEGRLEASEAAQKALEVSRDEFKAQAEKSALEASEAAQREIEAREDYRQAAEALEKMRDEAAMRLQQAEAAEEREQKVRDELAAERARFESMSLWQFLKAKRKAGK